MVRRQWKQNITWNWIYKSSSGLWISELPSCPSREKMGTLFPHLTPWAFSHTWFLPTVLRDTVISPWFTAVNSLLCPGLIQGTIRKTSTEGQSREVSLKQRLWLKVCTWSTHLFHCFPHPKYEILGTRCPFSRGKLRGPREKQNLWDSRL